MQPLFTPATTAHIPLITQLAGQIWQSHYPAIIGQPQVDYMLATRYSASAIQQGMQQGEQYYLAYVNNQPVGYAAIQPNGQGWFLNKFYLQASNQRRGLGTAFFNYLLQKTGEGQPIRLQVNRQNITAINFYFKMGFVIEQSADFDIGEGYYMNDFVMLRR